MSNAMHSVSNGCFNDSHASTTQNNIAPANVAQHGAAADNAAPCASTTQNEEQYINELQAQIEELRAKIVDTLMQIDYITLQENPRIKADYAVKVGYLVNELLRAQVEARRERRRYEMAQARANAGASIDDAAIAEALAAELAAWEQRIEERFKEFAQQMEERESRKPMTPAEAHEMKKLHRNLVKRLHPDLGNANDPDSQRFFLITQAAFKVGDLEALRAIEFVTRHLDKQPKEINGIGELVAERELLQAQLSITEERLQSIMQQDPYALKAKIEDAQWVCEKVKQLKEEIAQQEAVRDAYKQRFDELRGSEGHDR